MKKNLRVIQINGFRGLFLTIFIVTCLLAGFIAFPAFCSKLLWNYVANLTGSIPEINLLQGLLLWGIVLMSCVLICKKKLIVSFRSKQELSEDELKNVLNKIKEQQMQKDSGKDSNKNVQKEITKNDD